MSDGTMAGRPEQSTLPRDALTELAAILPRLCDALNTVNSPNVNRATLRLEDWATSLGVSRRVIERERSAGRLPRPDLHIGRIPLWRIETFNGWLDRGGRV